MYTAPLIGITCGTSAFDHHAKAEQDRLNQSYCRAVALAGGIPVILPNAGSVDGLVERIDGLLLSGGYDVCPSVYGAERLNETVEVDGVRDAFELPLLRKALSTDLPILAICRGIQILNVALGGRLWQDIPTERPSGIQHRQTEDRSVVTHEVKVCSGTRLAAIVGSERVDVNSFHHQAVRDLAEELHVSAVAQDGLVEAVEMERARFVVGVQWHPEDLVEVSDSARRLFRAFVDAARSH